MYMRREKFLHNICAIFCLFICAIFNFIYVHFDCLHKVINAYEKDKTTPG
jgi:hypothetical protein